MTPPAQPVPEPCAQPSPHRLPVPRVVAVDMDGTFLRRDNSYDRTRFARARASMRDAGCRFVVASGNQLEQLASFFGPGDVDAFVAESGALVKAGDAVRFCATLDPADAAHAVAAFTDADVDFVASGPEGAFVLDSASDAFVDLMRVYYHRLRRVRTIPVGIVPLFKFGTEMPEGLPTGLEDALNDALAGALVPVTSGPASLDLIIPGCHKASGLRVLMDAWGIDPADAVAFGDSANDLEMLRMVGHGVAMGNAAEEVIRAVDHHAGSNDEDGVLDYLERWFAG